MITYHILKLVSLKVTPPARKSEVSTNPLRKPQKHYPAGEYHEGPKKRK